MRTHLYTDEAQLQFDQWVSDLESRVLLESSTYYHGSCIESVEKFRVLMTQQINDPSLRLIQALIDHLGTTFPGSTNEAQLHHVIVAVLDHLTSLGRTLTEPPLNDFIEIYKFYEPTTAVHKQRNLCVVLSIYAANLQDDDAAKR